MIGNGRKDVRGIDFSSAETVTRGGSHHGTCTPSSGRGTAVLWSVSSGNHMAESLHNTGGVWNKAQEDKRAAESIAERWGVNLAIALAYVRCP